MEWTWMSPTDHSHRSDQSAQNGWSGISTIGSNFLMPRFSLYYFYSQKKYHSFKSKKLWDTNSWIFFQRKVLHTSSNLCPSGSWIKWILFFFLWVLNISLDNLLSWTMVWCFLSGFILTLLCHGKARGAKEAGASKRNRKW